MTLTGIGQLYFRSLVGGAGKTSTSVTMRDTSGSTVNIPRTPVPSSFNSNNPFWLFLGGSPVLDESNQVYKLDNATSAYFYPGGGSLGLSTSSSGLAKAAYSYQFTNSSSDSRTFTHYGFGFTSGSATLLVSYHQFPEPITIQAGETKTIQITIDVSNI